LVTCDEDGPLALLGRGNQARQASGSGEHCSADDTHVDSIHGSTPYRCATRFHGYAARIRDERKTFDV
jgi:hypothetical protein